MTTPSGIPSVGDIKWGAHFCHFYQTKEDLADCLVPYFVAGLENNEQCLWVTSEPFGAEAASQAVRAALPDFDRLMRRGQIEIIDYRDWYGRLGVRSADAILQGWLGRGERALSQGFSGLRLTGNTFWLELEDWESFAEYENKVSETLKDHRIIALCSYCLDRCHPAGVLDVVRNHEFAVARRHSEWEMVESATLALAKEELRRLNQSLEQRVAERTAALRAALGEKEVLIREIHHRVKNNFQIVASLLRIKAAGCSQPEVQDVIGQTLDRVRAMSLVHEMLYQDDQARIDFCAYLRTLCARSVELHGVRDRIEVEASSGKVLLDISDAVTLGLIANELLTNAIKHAFPNERPGRIEIAFRERDGHKVLEIRDDGVGLPATLPTQGRDAAGLHLVEGLVRQLDAEFVCRQERGTVCTVVVPDASYPPARARLT